MRCSSQARCHLLFILLVWLLSISCATRATVQRHKSLMPSPRTSSENAYVRVVISPPVDGQRGFKKQATGWLYPLAVSIENLVDRELEIGLENFVLDLASGEQMEPLDTRSCQQAIGREAGAGEENIFSTAWDQIKIDASEGVAQSIFKPGKVMPTMKKIGVLYFRRLSDHERPVALSVIGLQTPEGSQIETITISFSSK